MPHKSKNTADGGNQELDIAVTKVKIRIGKINILEIANKLQFGTYNDRAQNLSEVNKMIILFKKHRQQWYKESNALMIVIASSHLHAGQELNGSWNDQESLNEMKFVNRKPLILASGQHWVATLKKMVQAFIDEEAMLEKRITHIEGVKDPSDDSVTEHIELWNCLAIVKESYLDVQMQGLSVTYETDNSPNIIDARMGNLGLHLSQNQTLHIYAKTQEEELVLKLHDFYDVYQEEGKDTALELIQQEYEKGKDDKNLKLIKIWKNEQLVITLMCDILLMGAHYQHQSELLVHWLLANISVIMGGSKDTCEWVRELHQKILSSMAGEFKTFIPYIKGINELLEHGLGQKSESEDDKIWSDHVLARTYIYLLSLDMIPMLLMMGMVMDWVWKELDDVKEGDKEVSQWYKAMSDTMKISCPHTHTINNYMEALCYDQTKSAARDIGSDKIQGKYLLKRRACLGLKG
ncbi:uncharacterized protein BJ212DRAFT_1303720 [Suillus subaureus]|uniref:Uncharacterized protein n=1 Tax=Suillus subaureus TaxID=48587 RepID=A0A9P7DY83_9AGAM|nr:uncharacterized protein BJ212DRAFT_1303720 [Suillus subaureus]KAG1806206.1 hypothetical protein BJ212DRAFT_1303720 [Suillus subaureus]